MPGIRLKYILIARGMARGIIWSYDLSYIFFSRRSSSPQSNIRKFESRSFISNSRESISVFQIELSREKK